MDISDQIKKIASDANIELTDEYIEIILQYIEMINSMDFEKIGLLVVQATIGNFDDLTPKKFKALKALSSTIDEQLSRFSKTTLFPCKHCGCDKLDLKHSAIYCSNCHKGVDYFKSVDNRIAWNMGCY